jgi:adenine-specific DNA-methyltransferase
MVDSDAVRIEKAIRKVQKSGDESALIDVLLQDALNWPLSDEKDEDIKIEDISYSWDDVLVEMGFSSDDAPIELRQVMPFPNWPHGIFIVKFGSSKFFTKGRGMTTPLRAILRELMDKVRPTADHPSWKKDHLLFLCHSETEYFQFARFEDPKANSKTSKLQMFGWGPNDHIRTVCEYNLTNLIYKQSMNEDEATEAVASAFDVSKVSKKFYEDYEKAFSDTKPIIENNSSLTDANEIHQTTQTLFNRILFLRFIEKKGWLHYGETDDYLRELFNAGGVGSSTFYSSRLKRLFFEGLTSEGKQNNSAYGEVPFLNGGLFEESKFDKAINDLPNEMFEPLLGKDGLFYNYNFTVQESTPLDINVAIDPEMIGTMFEKLVTDREGKGAFYTPRIVVANMCREAIKSVLEERTEVESEAIRKLVDNNDNEGMSIDDARTINSVLSEVKAIDPACGSGAYLLGLLHELVRVHTILSTTAEDIVESRHEMKLRIISRSIYGVDLEPFATNIAMLRLWLSLSVEAPKPLPLPNLDFHIETGDSLLAPDPSTYVFDVTGAIKMADDLAIKKEEYLSSTGPNTQKLREEIKAEEEKIRKMLRKKNYEADSVDYRVNFASVFTKNGGFDIILANPPYIDSESMTNQDKKLRKKIQSNYSFTKGNWDIYIPFIELGFRLKNSRGVIIYITPDKWVSKPFGDQLRVETIMNISSVSVFGRDTFESVNVDAIVTKWVSSKITNIEISKFVKEENHVLHTINKSELVEPFQFDWLFSNHIDILRKLDACPKRLQRFGICENACSTSDAYKLKDIIIDWNEESNLNDYFKIINTGTIGKYVSKWGHKKMTYLGLKISMPVSLKTDFSKTFPNSYGRKPSKPKIILKGLNLLDASLDLEGHVIPGKTTLIVTSNNKSNLGMLIGLLNSKILFFYLKEKYSAYSYNTGVSFTKNMINQIPIPEISKENLSRMKLISKKIIQQKNVDIDSDISELQHDIDTILYQCYGLSGSQIKIISNS